MRKAKEIQVQELAEENVYRQERGYLYMVETRIAGKRYRRFFRHGEKRKADAYVSSLKTKRNNVGNEKAAILESSDTQEMAARAVTKLIEAGAPATLEEAVDDYLVRYRATLAQSSATVIEVTKSFLDEKERENVSEPHRKDLKHRAERFSETFGNEAISTISEKDISSWLMGLELSPQTILNFRRVLHNLFAFALKRGHIKKNVVSQAFSPKVRRKRAVILSPEEVSDVLANCSDEILPAVAMMLFCGIRQGEMGRLDWSAVDLEDKTITISAEVAKRDVHERFVTMPDCLIEWIKPHYKRRGSIKPSAKFRSAFEAARKGAGFPAGEWPANALRKTFISCHYETHGSIDETARQAGTSVNIIHKHYRRLIKPKEARRLWAIEPVSDERILEMKGGAS